jgi:hypothetical protein
MNNGKFQFRKKESILFCNFSPTKESFPAYIEKREICWTGEIKLLVSRIMGNFLGSEEIIKGEILSPENHRSSTGKFIATLLNEQTLGNLNSESQESILFCSFPA